MAYHIIIKKKNLKNANKLKVQIKSVKPTLADLYGYINYPKIVGQYYNLEQMNVKKCLLSKIYRQTIKKPKRY